MSELASNPIAQASAGPSLPTALHEEDKPGHQLCNVLYVVALDPTRKFGSLEEQILVLAAEFRAHSACLQPLFLPGRDQGEVSRELQESGVDVEMLDLSRFRMSSLRRLLAIVKAHEIELVHWNFYHPTRNPHLWALKILVPKLRHYFTDHISRQAEDLVESRGIKRAMKRRLLKVYDRIFCISDYVHECVVRSLGPLPNLSRSTYFINTARFAPDPQVRERVRAQLAASDRFVVLIVANLISEKGVDVALRAMAQLSETVMLWVVGSGPEAETLGRLASELELGQRVRFFGLQRDVTSFMKASDVFTCPSLWGEAAGLVNIEALACGLPVIASRVGGIPEIVQDGVTGYLIPAGDHGPLAERIRCLLDDSASRERMSLAARASAIDQFSVQRRLPEYLDWYRALPS